jgi:hypothetical protein
LDVDDAIVLIRRRAGQEVIDRLLGSVAGGEVLVVGGSLIEGLGNRRSDLDFFLVGDSHPRDVPVRMAFTGNSWIDVEYVPLASLHQLAEKVRAVDAKNLVDILQITHKELDRYYRLATGVVVKGDANVTRALPLDAFRSVVKPWALVHAGAFAARAATALAHDQLTAALRYASHAAHFLAQGTLVDVGECYPSLKYSLEKTIRAHGSTSARTHAMAQLLHPTGDLSRYVDSVVTEIRSGVAACLADSADDIEDPRPVEPLAISVQTVPVVLTRKSCYEVLPEDVDVVADLLALPGFAPAPSNRGDPCVRAHRLVLREALADAGLLRTGQEEGPR